MEDKKKIISLCLEFLESNGINVEKHEVEQNVYTKLYSNDLITETDLGLTEINFAIAKIDSVGSLDKVTKKLEEDIENLIMLILTSSVEFSKKVDLIIRKRKKDSANIKILMTGTGNTSLSYKIRIISRIQAIYDDISVPKSRKKTEKVRGCVYSAYLSDIVQIYDEIGDELFRKNVRLRVKKDNIGVGKEIKDTLRNNPNQFWFFNNGITIVTNSPIDKSKNDIISLSTKRTDTFSIVNGAQTVSAAHDFFYFDGEKKETLENAKNALVLLRVVSVEEIDETNEEYVESTESMSERISKSLNRQKPIEAEDLAYYSPFVKSINKLYSDIIGTSNNCDVDNRYFCIIRRGESENESENNFEHSLTLIARAIRASGYIEGATWKYLPWKAVNTYNADILKMNDQDLKHSELFKTIQNGDREEFLLNYQYINLAIFLFKKYSEMKNEVCVSKIKNKVKIDIMRENGSWFFISFFFECLLVNDFKKKLFDNCITDFDEFITKTDFLEIILFFFTVVDDKKHDFKLKELRQEETYNQIRENLKNYTREHQSYKDKVQRLYITYVNGDVLRYKDYDAKIEIIDGKYLLKKESKIEDKIDEHCSQEVKNMREEKKALINNDSILIGDIEFNDLSLAAKFVEGRRLVKGYKNWEKVVS